MTLAPDLDSRSLLPVVEVRVVGELDIATITHLWDQLSDALSLRPERLVVDFGECGFLDAQAITVLLDAHRQAWRQGGRLVLRRCPEAARRLFRLARVDDVFTYDLPATA